MIKREVIIEQKKEGKEKFDLWLADIKEWEKKNMNNYDGNLLINENQRDAFFFPKNENDLRLLEVGRQITPGGQEYIKIMVPSS